jgi:hypothetical protein
MNSERRGLGEFCWKPFAFSGFQLPIISLFCALVQRTGRERF